MCIWLCISLSDWLKQGYLIKVLGVDYALG